MRHLREHRWWLGACGGGFALASLVGGFVGPTLTVFTIVYLAGSLLIEFETGEANSVSAADNASQADDEVSDISDEESQRDSSPSQTHETHPEDEVITEEAVLQEGSTHD